MLKKAVKQGRSEQEPEAYIRWYVEGLSERERSLVKDASRRVGVGRVRRLTFLASY